MSSKIKKTHVDVAEEVRERLRNLKERFGLNFNDLISMSLTFIERKETQILIEAGKVAEVRVNISKAHLHSSLAETFMDRGYDIFIPRINARQAHYIKRKLQRDLNRTLTILPMTTKTEDGYLLMSTKTQTQHT